MSTARARSIFAGAIRVSNQATVIVYARILSDAHASRLAPPHLLPFGPVEYTPRLTFLSLPEAAVSWQTLGTTEGASGRRRGGRKDLCLKTWKCVGVAL